MTPNWLRRLGSAALSREIARVRLDRECWKRRALGAETRERAARDRAEQQRLLMDRQVQRIQQLEAELAEAQATAEGLAQTNTDLEKELDNR